MTLPPVAPPSSLSAADRPGDIFHTEPCPGSTTMPCVSIASSSIRSQLWLSPRETSSQIRRTFAVTGRSEQREPRSSALRGFGGGSRRCPSDDTPLWQACFPQQADDDAYTLRSGRTEEEASMRVEGDRSDLILCQPGD